MSEHTITFELGGRVDLDGFEQGVAAFRRLVAALTPRRAGVLWVIDDLQPGSATITLRAETGSDFVIARIIADYENIGDVLAQNEHPMSASKRVKSAADKVKSLTEFVEYVRFQTPDQDFTIYPNGDHRARPTATVSIGVVTGRIQTLSNRNGLRFNLYDTIHDKAVACYLAPHQTELIREAWGCRAAITGHITREAQTGRPITIRQITDIETLAEPAPGAYRQARGAVPWQPGDLRPKDAIRRLRDA